MGLFSHSFSKPGPGVDKNAPKKKRFFFFFELYFRKFWKLIELNMLFILACLPIVTIGPAICGMTYVLRNYAQEKPTFLWSDFWDAFKNNWKQGFGLWVIFTIIAAITGGSFVWYFVNSSKSGWLLIPFAFCALFCIIALFMSFYAFLLAVSVELKLRYIIKNAVLFSVLGIKSNFLTAIFVLLIAVPSILFFPLTLPIVLCLTFSTIGFISVFNSYQYIVKYIVEPQQEKDAEEAAYEAEFEADQAKELSEGMEDEIDDDAPIFTDIGSQEVPMAAPGKDKSKEHIIH